MRIEIRDHTLPEHGSYSSITTYLACGWQYYLSKVLKLEEEPAVWFVGGNSFHRATEAYDRSRL